jgi:hypothetical protein
MSERLSLTPIEAVTIRKRYPRGARGRGRGRNGLPSPLAFGVLVTEYRDVVRLAGPGPLLRAAFAALAILGRASGYRAGSV